LTKQDEIREGMYLILSSDILDKKPTIEVIYDLLRFQDSQGVGIKGSCLGVTHPHLAGYYTFKSLIKKLDGAE